MRFVFYYKMSNKSAITSKNSCERLSRNSRSVNDKSSKAANSKKPLLPKNLTSSPPKEGKSCCTGLTCNYKRLPIVKPKKTTKSEICFNRKLIIRSTFDHCKKCGDMIVPATTNDPLKGAKTCMEKAISYTNDKSTKHVKNTENNREFPKLNKNTDNTQSIERITRKKNVQQYYRNENFDQTSDSVYNIDNVARKISSLDTIKELTEKATTADQSVDSVFQIYSKSESEDEIIDPYSEATVKKLKEFRKNNYFECHSAKSRIKTKGSVTALKDHKCAYRFYLNDRLFPVPLNTDHHKKVRCVECHLPLDFGTEASKDINGSIQAKVRISEDDKEQDIILMLPVREPLIIKEKRIERKEKVEREVVYFGVIKLSATGNSVFYQNLPTDSLALKYQKGYKEFEGCEEYKFQNMDKGDVIVI